MQLLLPGPRCWLKAICTRLPHEYHSTISSSLSCNLLKCKWVTVTPPHFIDFQDVLVHQTCFIQVMIFQSCYSHASPPGPCSYQFWPSFSNQLSMSILVAILPHTMFSNVVFPIIKYMDPILSPTSSGPFTAQELSGLWSCDPSSYNTLCISITSLSMIDLVDLADDFVSFSVQPFFRDVV